MNLELESFCFTGYRPQKFPFPLDRSNAEYINLENKLKNTVFSLPADNGLTFYTGMAMGFDIIAAETVLLFRRSVKADIKLIGVIPFRAQPLRFKSEWRERYNAVAEEADELIFLENNYTPGCYQRRNEYMVNCSDAVITWFDGTPGGTLNTLRYAKRKNRQIINLCEAAICNSSPDKLNKAEIQNKFPL